MSPLHGIGGHLNTYLVCLGTGERMGRTLKVAEQLHKANIYHKKHTTLFVHVSTMQGIALEVVDPIPIFDICSGIILGLQ